MPKLPEKIKFLKLTSIEKNIVMKTFDFLLFAKGDIKKKKKKCCETIERLIGDVYERHQDIPLSTNDYHIRIIEASVKYGIDAYVIASKQRQQELSKIRKEIIKKMYDQDRISFNTIGHHFNRSYSTIRKLYNKET